MTDPAVGAESLTAEEAQEMVKEELLKPLIKALFWAYVSGGRK